MRKYLVAAALGLVIAVTGAHAARAGTQDFTIKSFDGDYYLTRDAGKVADLKVTETIVAEFPDFDQNHGIERAIPETYQNHPLELRIQSVTDGHGNAQTYETYRSNGNLVVRIGDADRYVHGEKGYVITYTMRGVTLNFTDHEEFFWDINGDQWSQVFGRVEARIHLAPDLVGSLHDDKACYTGAPGSRISDCGFAYRGEADGSTTVIVATFAQQPLAPGQTLTVVLGFDEGTFADYSPSAGQMAEWGRMAASLAGPPLLALFFVVYKWRKVGRDAKGKGAIVPQYLPPKGVSVLGANAVLKEGFEPKAVSATIIDLAVRHYIKIYETKPDKLFKKATYELELIKAPSGLKPEEAAVVSMLFSSSAPGTRVELEALKTKLATKSQKIGKDVSTAMTQEGYFTRAPEQAKLPYYVAGGLLVVVGFMLSGILLGPGIIAAGVIVLVAATVMPARTLKGAELRDYLLGVRDYIKLAEAERLKVLQSPRGELTEKIDAGDNKQLVKLYEKLLPYAMLFGLEKEWAKQMAGLYEQAPDWYSGTSTFNAIWFTSSLSGFSTASNSVFAPPSSSGSSGFGGGSGGGGGGGGGGGW